MTDEQLGRKWAEANNKAPWHDPDYEVLSYAWMHGEGAADRLPAMMIDAMPKRFFRTESDAYAAVGAALRELKRRADEIAAVLEGVPT